MKHDPAAHAPAGAPERDAPELSLSEIAALSWRAIRGAGRSWGEAEEGAQAACWLARAGLDWAGMLLEVLDLPGDSAACPLRAGLRLADGAALPDGVARVGVTLPGVRCPAFILPFAAQAAARTGQALRLVWQGADVTVPPAAAPVLQGQMMPRGAVAVTIGADTAAAGPGASGGWPVRHRATVTAAQYARLNALMIAFTVPASAASLAGAGAAGDDND
ncbi:DUF3726 domain-containing protein [Rhodobacteraceae bacterium 2376]|uniref:DUF3726 domain-containing protein n=1 Tax=Rhabdonatronobacter sediminivivens TaxID=2743469 RepID=A0A7Z0HYY1_9RHOB|nr:DUF3726 domain-containing protein [Rhabdonatronobacter sediminivivens]NYS24760.1 DUF3726 domain-containing protein [Rhabdonatronobacter sediminivivens]